MSGFDFAFAALLGLFVLSFVYSIIRVIWRLRQGDRF